MKNSELMLKELRYLQGKKIIKVRQSSDRYHMCLHFEDGNFCVFSGEPDYDYGAKARLLDADYNFSDDDLLSMDLATQEEHDERKKVKDERAEAINKPLRRAEYEKLKAEFEGETK